MWNVKKCQLLRTLVLWCMLVCVVLVQGCDAASDRMKTVGLRSITVGGEIGRRIDVTVNNNLLVLDVDKISLGPFEKKDQWVGYIGTGKLIDAFVQFAVYTNDPNIIERKKYLVGKLLKTQEADGYIGIMKPEHRMWSLWDIADMSYIVYGLVQDYHFFGERQSLDAAVRLCDYIISRWSAEPQRKPNGIMPTYITAIGLDEALLALYDATGKKKYLDTCVDFRKLDQWNQPIVTGRYGGVEGHAYAYICRCIAQLRLHRIRNDDRLLVPTRKAMEFLTARDGLVITGNCGDHECWHDTQEGSTNLAETCATAYIVRLMNELLLMEADSRYGDIMERSIYNGLFAAQSPDGRRIRYYTAFDGPRQYFSQDMYCCPNNYRRIIAELPRMIYYRMNGGVAVNLYTMSTAKIKLDDGITVTIKQKTDYPSSGKIEIQLEPSKKASFPLSLRIPRWSSGAKVTVNGKGVNKVAKPGSFLTIERVWKQADRVELNLPMPFRFVKGRKAQVGRVAVMRGPVVFCLNRSTNKQLAEINIRSIVIDPSTLKGPKLDDGVRPGGVSCSVSGWFASSWYPEVNYDFTIVLSEFPDPGGEATYFKVPNPNAKEFVDDELCLIKK